MGNSFSLSDVDGYFDEIVEQMQVNVEIFQARGSDITPSLAYLRRADVRMKVFSICSEIKGVEVISRNCSLLGLAYIELDVLCENGEEYTLNLWPCPECACVGFEKKV